MLDFELITPEHKGLIEKNIPHSCKNMCDFSFGNLVAWSAAENTRIAEKDGFVFIRSRFNGVKAYAFPWGKGDFNTGLNILENDARERKCKLNFYCVSEEQLERLKSRYNGNLSISEQRDFFDYIYLRENLAELKGRRYHSKKNHVNSFLKKYSYSFEKINDKNLSECLEFSRLWHKQGERNPKLDEEKVVIDKAFKYFYDLELSGALIRVDGKIVAYALGEAMADGETYCTHFEKASPDLPQAYAVINKLFAEVCLEKFKYINREDDAGSEGLRKAKTSYHPEFLIKKYYVEVK